MEISIQSDTNNLMLKRREITFVALQDSSTPTRDELKKEICKKLNLDPDSTILVEVRQEFGMRRSAGKVHSYKTKEQLMAAEPKYLTARRDKAAAKKEGKSEATAPTTEKKEEKKEEKATEDKPHKEQKKAEEPKEKKE